MSELDSDRERLQKLLEEARAPVPRSSPKPPKKRRVGGLLDLLAVSAAVYTLVVVTPVGGLVQRGYQWALGRPGHTRPLVSYFSNGSGKGVTAQAVRAESQIAAQAASTSDAATKAGVDPELARALALILSEGRRIDGHFDVKLPRASAASFKEVGAIMAGPQAQAELREATMLAGLGKLQAELSSPEAAVAALAVDLPRVKYALQRARVMGVANAAEYAGFEAFLLPEDRVQAAPLVHGTFALVTAFGMGWPVPEGSRISSPFGQRRHPVLGTTKMHNGIDLAVGTGTEVRAIAAGRVLYTASDRVNGRFLKIDHGHGLTSIYCHNSKVTVKRGARLKRGDRVADSGATGRVSGPHLHFQMEIDDVPVDPELFWHPKDSLQTKTSTAGH